MSEAATARRLPEPEPQDVEDIAASTWSPGPGDVLLIASLAALLAAAGHVMFVILRVFVMQKFSWATRDIMWMAPLSYAVFTVPATVLAALVAKAWPRVVSSRGVVTIPFTIAIFGVLLLVRVIHPLALLLVSLGIASQIARFFTAYSRLSLQIARFAVIALVGLVIGSTLFVRVVPRMAEGRVLAAGGTASSEEPNVLLIILDTVRAANMGLYGYARNNTPQLARLASEGIRFDRAIAPSSWTLPTHAALFTGVDARHVNAGWKRSLGDSLVTLADVLAGRGYLAAGFTANPQFTTWETGIARGFHRWDDFDRSLRETFWSSSLAQTTLVRDLVSRPRWSGRWRALREFDLTIPGDPRHVRRPGKEIVDRFLSWQESVGDRRFLAFLNLFDAHDPYVEPPGWTPQYRPRRSAIDTYDSSIAYMDAELGRLFDVLRQRGVLDRTIVVVSSDHGEQFGEHGLILHGNSLYMNSIHVPLVMRLPGAAPAGVVVKEPVSLAAVPATVLDLLGVPEGALPGETLRHAWLGVADTAAVALSWLEQHPWGQPGDPATAGAVASLVDGTYHWLMQSGGKTELYAWADDSLELVDLAADSTTAAIRTAFLQIARSHRMP